MVKLLKKKNCEAIGVSNGREAISLIADHKFDRVVCDLMLQDISGFDVIEETIALFGPKYISQNFILMTAYSSKQVLSRASNYQCKLLRKPFDNLEEAINMITRDHEPTISRQELH